MEEDDDAFLYGDDGEAAEQAKAPVLPEDDANKLAEAPTLANDGEEASGRGTEDAEDEEDDSDESDSDLEIIVDGSAGPPAGYNSRQSTQPSRAVPIQRAAPSVITSDYTPNARPGQTSSASSLAALTGIDSVASIHQAESGKVAASLQQSNDKDALLISDLPEGPPPPVPMTAPRLDLDPPEQALMLPPETIEDEPGPLIYHIDPTEFEEKPWRKPGADLTDWFNYGFNEDSWRLWGDKKYSRTMDRKEMEANGGRGGMIDEVPEEVEQDHNESSNYVSQMPQQQQLQAMQAMMGGGAGPTMSAEQMMAFMGMGSGGMPGMGMMGMPSMAAMFGQQNSNPFGNAFPGMSNMPMMQTFQSGQIGDGSLMRFANPTTNNNNVYNEQQQIEEKNRNEEEEEEYHPNGDSSFDQFESKNGEKNGHDERQSQPASREQSVATEAGRTRKVTADDTVSITGSSAGNADTTRSGMSIQGRASAGIIPTGPSSRATSIPKGPSADRNSNTGNLPDNIPTGPKHPGRRYNDRDTGMGVGDSLDYGANAAHRDREESVGRSPPRHGRSRSGRGHSVGSRDVSTDRDRDGERDRDYRRDRNYDDRDGHTSSRRSSNRDRISDRKRFSSPEDGMEKLSSSRRDKKGDDRRTSNNSQRRSGNKRGDYREESYERGDEWERESVESNASRRRTSTRHHGDGTVDAASNNHNTRRTNARSERRRGAGGGADEADSGSETERERKPGRDQKRADRRAGRDYNESSTKTSTRKRSAPEDDLSPVRSSTSRKRR